MRTHLSTVAAIFVALLFVSGTVGCRSNGGPWYNPTSYTWMKPSFAKDNQAPPYSPEAFVNKKPALEGQPHIERPMGGYSDEPSFQASRSSSLSSPSNNYPIEQSSYHNPVASNTYGGYTVAEPSSYPPPYDYGSGPQPMQQQYQYPAEMAQQGNPYGDYTTGAQYPQTSAVYPSATPNQATPNYGTPAVDPYGNANPAMTSGNYVPFGASPQNDPYAAMQQQQQAPAAYPAPSPYANEGVPVASPYQPYQPAGAYSY